MISQLATINALRVPNTVVLLASQVIVVVE